MVLSHRTGFPNWRYLTASKKLAFEFKPGARYQYSGEGFEYLRKALERKFGKSLDVLARETVFGPWGMADTHYAFTAEVDRARYASPHDAGGRPIALAHHTTINGAANLLTTVSDYARFMVRVMDGAGLPPALYADMIRPQARVPSDVDYGLGWKMYEKLDGSGEYALQHTGGDDGIKAIAILLPKSKRGLLVIPTPRTGYRFGRKSSRNPSVRWERFW